MSQDLFKSFTMQFGLPYQDISQMADELARKSSPGNLAQMLKQTNLGPVGDQKALMEAPQPGLPTGAEQPPAPVGDAAITPVAQANPMSAMLYGAKLLQDPQKPPPQLPRFISGRGYVNG